MFQSGGEAKSTGKGHMPLCISLILLALQSVKGPIINSWEKYLLDSQSCLGEKIKFVFV